jgi:hypothetical protein
MTWTVALLAIAWPAIAEEPEPSNPTGQAVSEPAPEVGLDQLLRLPNSFEADVDRRSGATASEWRSRFEAARKHLDDAKVRLDEIERELQQVSETTSGWAVAAPGSKDPQASPLSLRLRQELKQQRTMIDDAERRLRTLDVEADLAAVPQDWRSSVEAR